MIKRTDFFFCPSLPTVLMQGNNLKPVSAISNKKVFTNL